MTINIILRVLNGNFNEGFIIDVITDGKTKQLSIIQNRNIPKLYSKWQDILHRNTIRKISGIEEQETHVSTGKLRNAKTELEKEYKQWLNNQNIGMVISNLIELPTSSPSQSPQNPELVRIQLILSDTLNPESQKDNDIFRRLPWNAYLSSYIRFNNYDTTFLLSKDHTSTPSHPNLFSSNPPKILAIFGGHQGELASSQADEANRLKQICEPNGATVIFRNITDRNEFHQLLINDNYDILFYSGHSTSDQGGTIQFEQETSIIRDFKNDLIYAVKKGLKIAIFNSCDGLKIADFLIEEVGMPAVIVMKEPVADEFAREFLERFLIHFVEECNFLSVAVEKAGKDIRYKEDQEFPGATWLPITYYSNAKSEEFTWSKKNQIYRNRVDIKIHNYFYHKQNENALCPYQGLFHFGPEEAEYFFGRQIFIEQLYNATQNRKFIPILGASGSGKSSVVLAGLVPKLKNQGNWEFTYFRPGKEPFHALATALIPLLYTSELDTIEKMAQGRTLATHLQTGTIPLSDVFTQIQQKHPTEKVLIIADQFEEIYTLCPEPETRHQFLDCLIASLSIPNSPIVLVTTMRADFLSDALSYRPLGDTLQNADLKILAMNREELTEVIIKPAEKLGVSFEQGLAARILNDLEQQPGNLPLLEFALTQLWNQHHGWQLTHNAYEKIGQVQGALARYADEKYSNLTKTEQEKIQRIFIQLIKPGEGAEDTRRIAFKTEIGEENWLLVRQLADARLVVTSRNATEQETVEVVHEALIRDWGELRKWINNNREFRNWQERLRVAREQWRSTQKDRESLLRGAALAQAEEKLKERPEELIDEREFIEESIKENKRVEEMENKRKKREVMTAWGIAAGSLVAVVVSAALGIIAIEQKNQTEVREAESLGRYSLSLFQEHKQLEASLNAIKASRLVEKKPGTHPLVISALQNIFSTDQRHSWRSHEYSVISVTISPDGKTLVSGSSDNTIKIWEIGTGNLLLSLIHI